MIRLNDAMLSYVGNNVDYNKLDKILNNSSVAYRNSHNKDILL